MRGFALFLGGVLLGSAVQTGIAQGDKVVSRTNSTIANATSPDDVRIELSELGPESLQRKAMNRWR